MSHNPNHIISTTTINHQNSLLINQTYRHDFKNQRSSSEPVHEQNVVSNLTLNSNTNSTNSTNSTNDSGVNEDVIKNNGFIDCLQNISAIKVRK